MPAFIAPLFVAAGFTGTITVAGTAVATSVVLANVAFLGLSFAAQAALGSISAREAKRRARRAQSAADSQQTIRGAAQPRARHYGRWKAGGVISFIENVGSDVYMVVVFNTGTIAAIEQFYLGDKAVLIDSDGCVTNPPFFIAASANPNLRSYARLQSRRGYVEQDAFSLITEAFPGKYTADHRLRGNAAVAVRYKAAPQSEFQRVWNSTIPSPAVVADFSPVWDMRAAGQYLDNPNTWQFSSNSALIAHDYLVNADGMAISANAVAHDTFAEAADFCDELVPLRDGGAERRYRFAGGYNFDEQPADVMQRIADSCRGEFWLTSEGKIAMRCAQWQEPAVTLTDDDLVEIRSLERGVGLLRQYNAVRPFYTSEAHGWQEMEAATQKDAAEVAELGRIYADEMKVPGVPSHSQAQRLAKMELYEENPARSGEFVYHLTALQLIGERVFRIRSERYNLDLVARITGLAPNDEFTQLIVSWQEILPAAYAWNPATDEGDAPVIPPETSDDSTQPGAPHSFAVVVETNGAETQAGIRWQATAREGQVYDFRWRLIGGSWTTQTGLTEAAAIISPVTLDESYDVEARVRTRQGGISPWGSFAFTAEAHDAEELLAPVIDDVIGGAESIEIRATQSLSPEAWALQWAAYEVPGSPVWDAENAARVLPGQPFSIFVSAGSGTWRVEMRARSLTGLLTSPVAGPVEITVSDAVTGPDTGGGGTGDNGTQGGGGGTTGGGTGSGDGPSAGGLY